MQNNAIQVWSPDTCECVIHFAYDDTLPDSERVLELVTEEQADAINQARLENAKAHSKEIQEALKSQVERRRSLYNPNKRIRSKGLTPTKAMIKAGVEEDKTEIDRLQAVVKSYGYFTNKDPQPWARLCEHHALLGSVAGHTPDSLSAIHAEVALRGNAERIIQGAMPDLQPENIRLVFDEDRILVVELADASAQDKAKVMARLDAGLGVGKIKLARS